MHIGRGTKTPKFTEIVIYTPKGQADKVLRFSNQEYNALIEAILEDRK